ncbi:hypothetical protein CPC08DRAFT_62830 [Agrocybe pediades]|nr:hypothetical protein CPC08DRAFT_62830 [Agrocybe pediades]
MVFSSLAFYSPSRSISYRYLSFLRIASVAAFSAYVYSQAYALSYPANKGQALSSPISGFLVALCGISVALNIYWLGHLFFDWDIDGNSLPLTVGWAEDSLDLKFDEKQPLAIDNDPRIFSAYLSSAQARCLPFTIAGNTFMSGWAYAWTHELHDMAQVLLACNLAVLLYGVFVLLHVEEDDIITPSNIMTHLVMKTNTGLAVLFLWTCFGVFDPEATPEISEIINNGILFLLMTVGTGPDPTLGLCMLYNLLALLSGPISERWKFSFQVTAALIIFCLTIEFKISKRDGFRWIRGFSGTRWMLESGDLGEISLDNDFSSAHLLSTSPVLYTPSIVPSLSYHNWTTAS